MSRPTVGDRVHRCGEQLPGGLPAPVGTVCATSAHSDRVYVSWGLEADWEDPDGLAIIDSVPAKESRP